MASVEGKHDPDTLLEKARALEERDLYQEAMEFYDEAIKLHPSCEAFESKGDLLAGLHRHGEAEECYEEAIRLCDVEIKKDPDVYSWFLARAEILDKMGRHKQATKCYDWAFYLSHQPCIPTCFTTECNTELGRNMEYGINYTIREPGLEYYTKDSPMSSGYIIGDPYEGNTPIPYILAAIDAPKIGGFYKRSQHEGVLDMNDLVDKGNMLADKGRHDEAAQCHDEALRYYDYVIKSGGGMVSDFQMHDAFYKRAGALYRMDRYTQAAKCHDLASCAEDLEYQSGRVIERTEKSRDFAGHKTRRPGIELSLSENGFVCFSLPVQDILNMIDDPGIGGFYDRERRVETVP